MVCIIGGGMLISGFEEALAEAKELLEKTQASSSAIAAAVAKVEQIGKSF
jgi:F-type H+-transporting ATPase subunit epsilon